MKENTENLDNGKEINLIDFLKQCLKNIWVIILCAIIGAGAGYVYKDATSTQQYRAESLLYVNNTKSLSSIKEELASLSLSDIYASQSIVDVYCIIIKTHTTLNEVSKRLNNLEEYYPEVTYKISDFGHDKDFKYSYDNLYKKISVASVDETEIFKISVATENKQESILISNVVADVATTNISKIINGTSVKVVDYAVSYTAISRGIGRTVAIGLVLGAVLSLLVLFIISYFNDIIDSTEWLKRTYGDGIPVLSVIPDSSASHHHHYYKKYYNRYSKNYGNYYAKNSEENGNESVEK